MFDVNEVKKMIWKEVDLLRAEMDCLAHELYLEPEVGWETPRSIAKLSSFMENHGLIIERNVAGLSGAFMAYDPGRYESRPSICFLAEYDALPKIGHGCGHNLSGTVAAGSAIAIIRIMNKLGIPGGIYVMGCPCEEGGGGKVIMAEKGVFEVADFSMHWHAANNPADRIVVGCPTNAGVRLWCEFRGKHAHPASSAHKGISALEASILTLTAINALERYLIPENYEKVHGVILSGGEAANIIPDYSKIELSLRAKTKFFLEDLVNRVSNCARGAALATGADLDIVRGLTYFERIVLQSFRRVALNNLPLLGLPVEERDPYIMGSADSSNVSHVIPHLTFRTPITDDGSIEVHTVEMAQATDTDTARDWMNKSAKWMAMIALDLLTDSDLREEIKSEFKTKKRIAKKTV